MSNKIKKDLGLSTPIPLGNYTKALKQGNNSMQLSNGVGGFENINNMNIVNKEQGLNQFGNYPSANKSVGSAFKNAFNEVSNKFKGAGKNVGGAIVDGYKNIVNNYKDFAGKISNSSEPETGTTTPVDNYWKELQSQIKQNTLNSKNEVAMAQRKASQNMDNYLKALGIQNTGLGQSQYASLASDYANAIADINRNEEQQLLDVEGQKRAEQMELNEKKADQVLAILEAGGNADDYINQLKAEGVDTTFLENYAKTIYDNKAKAEADQDDVDNEDIYYKGSELLGTIKANLGTMYGDEKSRAEKWMNEMSVALNTENYDQVDKLMKQGYNIGLGIGGVNDGSQVVDTYRLKDNEKYVSEMKPEDFPDNGKLDGKQRRALERLLKEAKEWAKTGENDGVVFEVGWGARWDDYWVFDAKNGTFRKLTKKEGKNATNKKFIKDMYKGLI